MSDLVERLRKHNSLTEVEAAARIERLEAALRDSLALLDKWLDKACEQQALRLVAEADLATMTSERDQWRTMYNAHMVHYHPSRAVGDGEE